MRKNKAVTTWFACGAALLLLAGCGSSTADTGNTADGAESTQTDTEKENLKQAGLGGLIMLYDDSVWTQQPDQETDSSLVFEDQNESILGISCSKEATYQHPLDMISLSEQIYATYEGYEEVEEPTEVEVQDASWYEWVIRYEENGVDTVSLQRFYAKNYYVYTMTYVAEEAAYEAGKSEAVKAMNSVVMSVPDNAEAEEKAKEFLVGTWSIGVDSEGDKGYLVLEEDGTYEWYMDSSMDAANMHTGTYGCDVENTTLGFDEGEGVYLVLYPEALYVDGEKGMTGSPKYDYAFSLEQGSDGSYPMMNVTTFDIYTTYKN
ncbi:MAG: hypothetical protein LUI12_05695 [Clostridiales bacterium]|nr:hypothetical protein [Clostridiales bacterium]